jgi:hypothetical protein
MNISINKLIKQTEKTISDACGFKIKLNAKILGNYNEDEIIEEIEQIYFKMDKAIIGIETPFEKIDRYYFTLLIINEKMPFLNSEIIAKALNKERTTIIKAQHKADELLINDEQFNTNYKKILEHF